MANILVIDDDINTVDAIIEGLTADGYTVSSANNGKEALEKINEKEPDLVLTDLMMPGMNGLKFLKMIKKLYPDITIVIITGFGSVETAVEAMREGAYDYLTKPLRMQDIRRVVSKALEQHSLIIENKSLKAELFGKSISSKVIGSSRVFKEILKVVYQIAPTRGTVLITGESGTGKEIIAELIHYNSPRKDKPLVKINCSALPENLIESELFGHEKGAFTGAIKEKPGRFELANGGTIFLDEVGDISPHLQVKLLRVLQEGEFERVGGTETLKVDARLIAATNHDLKDAVEQKKFREDLYYRLNVINIHLPPMREREEDVPLLVNYFLEKYSKENNKDIKAVDDKTMQIFKSYTWPGNVRELENTIEHAVIMCRNNIVTTDCLPQSIQNGKKQPDITFSIGTQLEDMEKNAILRTLDFADGNREEAANILGIGVATLYRKLQDYQNEN
ncbi:MAG: sigma-54 dependent transcriptional regulator [bacterium]|nr:sigma-54 dependent transcriptional regulator [bacterium]